MREGERKISVRDFTVCVFFEYVEKLLCYSRTDVYQRCLTYLSSVASSQFTFTCSDEFALEDNLTLSSIRFLWTSSRSILGMRGVVLCE